MDSMTTYTNPSAVLTEILYSQINTPLTIRQQRKIESAADELVRSLAEAKHQIERTLEKLASPDWAWSVITQASWSAGASGTPQAHIARSLVAAAKLDATVTEIVEAGR